MIGFTSFLVMRMWFGKAVEDFNDAVLQGGSSSPALVAQTGNGFVSSYCQFRFCVHSVRLISYRLVVYVAYAFYAVPLVCSLAKLHILSGKA